MLQNEYLLGNIDFDTAENEPSTLVAKASLVTITTTGFLTDSPGL